MYFTQVLIVAIVAVAGASASPPGHPAPPAPPRPAPPAPVFNTQSIQCSSGAPYCCSPSASNTDNLVGSNGGSTTCSEMTGSTSCDATIVCCNNAAGTASSYQSCSGSITGPVIFK